MMQRTRVSAEKQQPRGKTGGAGFVLVLVLLMVCILGFLGWALLRSSFTETVIARNDADVTQALYVAEGGIHSALNALNQGGTPPSSGTIGPGQFTVVVTDVTPPTGQKRIEATGFVPVQASPRGVKRLMVLLSSPPLPSLPYGLDAKGVIKVSGGGTDSYNSSSGPYNAGTAGSNGHVRTNGNVDLSGSALIRGNAMASGTVNDPTKVTGTLTNGAPSQTLSDKACPSGSWTPSVPPGSGVTYDAGKGDLTVSGGNNLTLTAPGTYYFHKMTLSGGSTLTFSGSGRVELYIAGEAHFSDGSLVNTSAIPSNLLIMGCGTDTRDWTLSGGSGAYFAMYTPNHKVTISGGSGLYGALVASQIDNSGGSMMHYDEALGGGGSNRFGKYTVVVGSWSELVY